jgi:hypothetical protein
MKLFNNPFVVGGLALLALGLVARSLLPAFNRGAPSKPSAKQTAKPAQAKPAAAKTAAAKTGSTAVNGASARETSSAPAARPAVELAPPVYSVDAQQVEISLAKWMSAPKRDPFQVTVGENAPPRAEEVLELTAVWRQSGSHLAVVNGKIVGEGEAIEGFTIETIDENHLWLQGPRGAESLRFRSAILTGEPVNEKVRTAGRPDAL